MSQENVEIVKRAAEALANGDLDAATDSFDPDIEWEETAGLGPDADVYQGIEEVRAAVESWLGMWSEYEIEARRYVDVDDDVVALFTERGRGRDSGVVVERELGEVLTVRGGKIVRSRLFGSWQEALEAAGLSE